jgi:hypothetical protein
MPEVIEQLGVKTNVLFFQRGNTDCCPVLGLPSAGACMLLRFALRFALGVFHQSGDRVGVLGDEGRCTS